MTANNNEFFRALSRVFIRGAKQVGTRAAAHGMKSVFRDGERLANGVKKKLAQAVARLDEMTEYIEDDVASDREQDDERRRD